MSQNTELYQVPLADCRHSKLNVRQSRTAEDIERLAERIRRHGFDKTRPLWVVDGGDCAVVFAGGTRLEAARLAGLESVPVLVHRGFSDEEIRQLSAQDNEHDATDVSSNPLERTHWPVSRIQVGHRHRQDLGDVEALAGSIQALGLLHPLVVTPEDKLVAGGRRLAAVKRLGWESVPVTVAHNLTDAIAALRAERDENTCRKELTVTEKVALGQQLEALEREAAQQRQQSSRFQPDSDGAGNFPAPSEEEKGETRDKVGAAVGLSGRTYQKAKAVIQAAEAQPEKYSSLLDAMNRSGKVNGAFRRLKTLETASAIAAEPPPLPEGPFRVLVVDPPWAYAHRPDDPSHRAANPYPSLTAEEIAALPVPALAHEDAVLWLWTTNAHLFEAGQIVQGWGFTHKTMLIWVKDRMGLGDYLRGQTEPCLLAVRGRPVLTLSNQTTALQGPLREHSRKPEEFYTLVESLCPGSKVELFARTPRPGWTAHGNQVTMFADSGAS